ncbi:unnamed protein product [Periconia digitata]|uniref:Uncharacterized protein n=1 Tax=Periconia digitata TaxID=1303443 RepID=A0A9W4UXF4_9PLEO|nr:unnamed protein product [Periconia digitata]
MPESSFLFLNVNSNGKVSPTKYVRSAIQKHVMRDIGAARQGKPRPRPQSQPGAKQNGALRGIGNLNSEKTAIVCSSSLKTVPALVSGGSRTDPFTQYPVPMNSDTLFLIDYIYTTPKVHLRPLRDTWLPLALSDPAFFYEILSHVALNITTAQQSSISSVVGCGYQASTKSLALHSLALRSINQRLTDPMMGLSEGVIGTIMAFACFSYSLKDWKSYAMHMDGLLAIIKAKGGIHKIDHNRILRLILSGIDVSASCFTGTRPRFPSPTPLLSVVRSHSQELPWWFPLQESSSAHSSNVWTIMFPHDVNLADIFHNFSIAVMTIILESDRRLLWQDGDFAKTWIDPLTYRLLESTIEIECVHKDNFMTECCRLGALILLARIRRQFNVHTTRLVFTGLETAKLKLLLVMYAKQWTAFQPMLLWVLFLGAIEVDEAAKVWFCDLIRERTAQLEIREWDDIFAYISNLLWVGQVLDAECEKLRPLIMSAQGSSVPRCMP